MAKIGLRYPAVMQITGYDTTGMPKYASGIFVGKGVKADISYEGADAELHADDMLAEYDNGTVSYSGTLEVDGFGTHQSAAKETDLSVLAYLRGTETESGESDDKYTEALETTGASAPYLGFVYIKRKVKEGKTYWVVKHCYKVCFKVPNDSAQTKEKSTTFNTSSVDFTGMGVEIMGKEEPVFTKDYLCETLENAIALLKSLAHIAEGVITPGA